MGSAEIKKSNFNLTCGLLDLIDATAEIASEIGMYAPKMRKSILFYHPGELDELMCLTDAIHNYERFLNDILESKNKEQIKYSLQLEKIRLTEFLNPDSRNAFSFPSISSRIEDVGHNKLCKYTPIMIERNTSNEKSKFQAFTSYLFGDKSSVLAFNAANITSHKSSNRLHMIQALINALDSLVVQLDDKPSTDRKPDLDLTHELAKLLITINKIAIEMRMYSSYAGGSSRSYFPESALNELKDLSDSIRIWRDITRAIRMDSLNDLLGSLDWLEGEFYIYLNYPDNAFVLPQISSREYKNNDVSVDMDCPHAELTYYEYGYDIGKMPNAIQKLLSKSKIGKIPRDVVGEHEHQIIINDRKRTHFIKEMLQSTQSIKSKTIMPL